MSDATTHAELLRRTTAIEDHVQRLDASVQALQPAHERLDAYLATVHARQPDRDLWDKTVQQQLSALVGATNALIDRALLEDWRTVRVSTKLRTTGRISGPILGGIVAPLVAVWFTPDDKHLEQQPSLLVLLTIIGAAIGMALMIWLTADVPPPPNAPPVMTKLPPPSHVP